MTQNVGPTLRDFSCCPPDPLRQPLGASFQLLQGLLPLLMGSQCRPAHQGHGSQGHKRSSAAPQLIRKHRPQVEQRGCLACSACCTCKRKQGSYTLLNILCSCSVHHSGHHMSHCAGALRAVTRTTVLANREHEALKVRSSPQGAGALSSTTTYCFNKIVFGGHRSFTSRKCCSSNKKSQRHKKSLSIGTP